jgi:hypothetical protein
LAGQREKEFVLDAPDSGWYPSIGKYVEEFETNFARYCGTEYALTVSRAQPAFISSPGRNCRLSEHGAKRGNDDFD